MCWGGTGVLVENALELADVSEPVTYASMVPTAAAELLRMGAIPASLRTLNLAGEALTSDLAQGLYGLGTVEKVGNVYGPTEDTTYSTYSLVPKGAAEVRIGRPLPGTRAYVLDANLNPVPVGVAGELYLAGDGLARGYAARPALTAERFIPDPFSPTPGARMYCTQDRVRWRADGELEYFGRTDHQVKVRGFRVELGEIGTVLGTHPAVAEAVVVSRKHGGDVRLVAYVVAQSETDAADLRAYLEARLPAYMVPAAFVLLDRLPLTGSGKIDRNALPAPEWGHAAADEVTPPRTPTEEVLAGIYAEMLGVERVGRESNFFELGGHSLLATRVVSRLRDVFRIELPVRALFERPTVAGLAERIDAARRTDRPAPPPIVARPHDGEAPLSFAQERLWFVEQMHPGTASNNIARPLHLAGPLDVRALQDALDEVVRRHETLRTTFASVGGRPVQKIAPTGSCPLHFVDLEPAAEDEREARAARLVAEESERPFDLAAGPLFRAMLVRSGPEDHTLLLTMHHIVSDGWSLGVLVGEVAELYRAFLAGEPSPLAPLAVQYSDFCRWQREWLQGDVLEVELRYWVDRLGGPQPLLQLPTDRPRGPVRSGRGAVVRQSLPSALVEKLERLALGSGASPFMALLAGFVSLLNRYTGQDDVRVGTFIANRTRAEVEPLFGFFLNNLVLRAGVSADDTFRTLLAHVRDVTLDAYAHQEVPFEKVLEAVNPERTLSHTPLFQVMFVLQNTPVPALRARDLTVRALPVESTGSNFDLTLWVEETDGLRLTLQYDTDLFDDTTIERLLGHLAALLEGAVADPDAPLGRIPLLDAAERHALLVEINDTGPVPATDRPGVHHLIESQAHASPDAVAVRQGRVALTYGELNATANRLAHNLRARGVGTETRVALLANRSPRMIAGLLGILKSGAAYVPLDPRAPAERLAHILRDSGAAVLVADEPLVGDLSAHVPAVVALDGAWGDEDGAPSHDPAPLGGGNDAAYVIYTSGSTGRPKGVLVEHRSMRAYTETAAAQYAIGPEDRLLQFASVSFDASIEEIFPALVSGAALVLRDDAMLGSPALFWEACAREGVTVVNLPTAYWHELAGALEDGGSSPIPPSVRLVIIGGERALNERVARWQRVAGPGVRLVNTYGPTEATVVATLRDLAAWDAASGREVPIGGPVRGARAYVLDAAGEPSPVGVPGELYLGGAGLARGYLDRPALTAERFVPDPFAAEPGARLYRTGDLARVLPGGDLEFAGRGDGQIKIRGYRVELQEIEARLADHPAVRTAAVVLRKSPEGEPYLAAFVVPAGDEAPTTAEVRAFLGQSLPEYMVPSLVVRLDALPMTPGGKVDARALPATERPREESSAAYVAPRTPAEEILASIWAQVLGVERVGVNDSFFELGGYSLLATQVIARIRDAFGVELPLVKVFQARTLAELAESVTDASRTPLPELRRVPRDGPLPLSFAQERIWFLTQLAPELSAYHVPRALRIRGPLTREAIEQSYAALVQRHEVLRTTFPAVNGRPVQVIHPSATVEVPLVDLSGLPEAEREAEVQRIILEVGRKRFDLTHGPLIRVVLLRLGPDEHVAVQAEHHLVHDGWAEGVLMGDLLGAFSAFVEGRPVELPELPIQFADYAAWQRKWVDGPVLEEQLAYWKEQLAGAPAVLELPTDRPRPPVQRFQGGEEFLRLSGPTVAALQEMGRHEGVTLFMAALAGFNALLHRYTGQDDVVVGTVLANRRWREAEGLLGMILNTLPLRTRMHGDPTVRELLAEVRQTCLGAYGHQDTPFEMIVDAVRPPRNLSYPPVFQVMFAFHDARMPTLRAPGFTFTPLDAHNRSSKFDMLVIAQANADGEGMTAAIEYNSDLFDAATIQRFTRHLENLLVTLPHSLDLRLSELPLMDGDERAELAGWNATSSPYAQAECLHELFEAQAARTPDADAVVWGEETWSYARLDARANAVAAELRARGVGPEVRVGVCARRTPALVAGLLGVMKAGGAYVPVDPAYPRDRQTYMLQDAGVAVVLGDEAVAECAGDVPVVSLELGERHEAPPRLAMPGNLAYVIYTSGSTGRPKGVAIEHRSAVAFACWAREVFEPEEFEAVLASTSVCFDLSVFELFVTLAWGGCVVLAENVLELPRLAAAERVRLVNTVPSGLAELVRTGGVPASVRTVNLAGEPLPGTLVEEVYARTGVRRVLNLYGPSEDTTYSTGAEIPRGERMPSIGGPIANTQAHVVDARGRLTPVGVPGELYLGGAGLARGYWNRPALTAERFVPDPHGGVPGARLYRTGDQVRRGRTGALEFLGRRDHQVKVRGFRIELGEIDAVLRAHPAVLESVTVVREDAPGDRRLVAYVAAKPGASADAAALRAHLEERLPAYMVPAAWVWLERLPLSPTGKIDRAALPAPEAPRADADADYAAPQSELTRAVAGVWAEVLGVEKVGLRSNFFDLGGHSLLALRAQHRLSEVLGRHVPLMQIFRHPTVQSLAEVLGGAAATDPAPGSPAEPAGERGRDVAIIGWAGRFPGADSVDALWRNVRAGIESVSFFSDDELLAAGVPAELLRDPAYVRAKGVLDGIERFDAAFFDVGPREAEITDPQHRIFLECAWEALEDAAYDPRRYGGSIGVFAGAGQNGYWMNAYADPEVVRNTGHTAIRLGNEKDFLPTRVSYKLGLRGPSVNVQTACSTSLVAVHLACQSLLRGECDMALAGAAQVASQQKTGYVYAEGGVHSPDGRCRAFDARAQGTVGGNGVGIVVLKPLDRALADRDHVYAVIRGSAINNDGSVKVGFTAPAVDGQAQAIAAAQRAAGVSPDEIGYVEAHGTGTPIGDPIEFAALAQVFGEGGATPCALGSIKTNIGHLDVAAGVTGLIKAALVVRDGVLPPSLHFEALNPRIAASGALEVNARLREWTDAPHPRRAGVSSFGLGGTNAHVVVEQPAPVEPPAPWTRGAHLLVVSARTQAALDAAAARLGRRLREGGDDLADVAYTLQVGRGEFAYRRAVVCQGREDGALALESGRGALDGRAAESASVAFQFAGEETAQVGMGEELYASEPTFRAAVDRFAELFRGALEMDLREVLYPSAEHRAEAEALLRRPSVAGAALFTVEAALAELWMEWGVRPEAMIGHGAGEVAAAFVAGVFAAEEAVRLVAERGRFVERLPAGAALADLPDEALMGLAGELGRMAPRRPRIPFVSTVTGTWIREREAMDPAYWVRQLRESTAFDQGMRTLLEEPRLLVEVGPGRTLTERAAATESARAVASLAGAGGAQEGRAILEALGTLWVEGVTPDWAAYHRHAPRSRVSLPTYPFQRERYWLAAPTEFGRPAPRPAETAQASPAAPRKVGDVGEWFYVSQWKPAPLPADSAAGRAGERWLLFVDEARVGAPLAEALARSGAEVTTVAIGERFAAGDGGYTVDPRRAEDYRSLVDDLAARGRLPQRIVHLWNVVPQAEGAAAARERGFDSLLHLTRALVAAGADDPLRIDVVTTGVQSVDGSEPLGADKATVLGICRVAPQERRNLSCRSIDLVLSSPDPRRDEAVVAELLRELRADSPERVVAYRRGVRWAESFARVQAPPQAADSRLRRNGVYLLLGGAGRIGLVTAGWLAREVGARLVLTSRSGAADPEAVRALEAAGAEVLVLPCDVSDEGQLRQVVERTMERFGALHGVIHTAGVVGQRAQRALEETGSEAVSEQFAAKVDGLRVLERVIGGLPLDFCLLFSSLSPILGGLGYTAYSAANHFVDAFARARSRDGGFPWTSVAWDAWRFGTPEALAAHADAIGVTPADAVEALPRALGLVGLPYLVISTADLDARRTQWVTAPAPAPVAAAARAVHPRPTLFTQFVPPRTPDEEAIAHVWSQFLAIEPIGVYDSFFELGGHSLLATQVTSRLRQTVQVDIPLRAFLEMPTVAGQAELLEALRAEPAPDEPELAAGGARSIEDELAEVTNLSDEQVAALLERVSPIATAE
ncbi:MAG TPA: amino acid adenylation domain-containing protein [Longimicrobium sp.]